MDPERLATVSELQVKYGQVTCKMEKTDDVYSVKRKLMKQGWAMLKQEGIMVYSTCSLTIEQNENNVAWFLSQHSDAELEPLPNLHSLEIKLASIKCISLEPKPDKSIQDAIHKYCMRFDPLTSRTSGFFLARFRKKTSNTNSGCWTPKFEQVHQKGHNAGLLVAVIWQTELRSKDILGLCFTTHENALIECRSQGFPAFGSVGILPSKKIRSTREQPNLHSFWASNVSSFMQIMDVFDDPYRTYTILTISVLGLMRWNTVAEVYDCQISVSFIAFIIHIFLSILSLWAISELYIDPPSRVKKEKFNPCESEVFIQDKVTGYDHYRTT